MHGDDRSPCSRRSGAQCPLSSEAGASTAVPAASGSPRLSPRPALVTLPSGHHHQSQCHWPHSPPISNGSAGTIRLPPPPSSREEAPLEPRCTDAGVATSTDTLGWPSAGPGAGRRPVTAGDHKDVCRARGHPARLAGQSVGSHSHLIPRGPAFRFLPLEHLGFSACKLQMLVVATLPKSYTDALNLARSGAVQTRAVCFTDAIRFMT